MKTLLWISAFLLVLTAEARKPYEQHWYAGEITLMNDQVLVCEYNYNAFTDLIQVKEENRVKIYSARQVKLFTYFDDRNNTQRSFVSLVYGSRFRSSRVFFEKVLDGEFNLLRRFRSVNVARKAQQEKDELWYDSRNYYNYFIYTAKGFTSFHEFRKEGIEQMLTEYKQPLEAFVRRKKLNLRTQRGAFLVINQYNILKGSIKLTAL